MTLSSSRINSSNPMDRYLSSYYPLMYSSSCRRQEKRTASLLKQKKSRTKKSQPRQIPSAYIPSNASFSPFIFSMKHPPSSSSSASMASSTSSSTSRKNQSTRRHKLATNLSNILNPMSSTSSYASSSFSSTSTLFSDLMSMNESILPSNEPQHHYLSLTSREFLFIVLQYLRQLFQFNMAIKTYTFEAIQGLLQSHPNLMETLIQLVQTDFTNVYNINEVVDCILEFIITEDIAESSMEEFLQYIDTTFQYASKALEMTNIFENLRGFFQSLLKDYKQFLIQKWINDGKMMFSCEFGKKSDTLFLCMECNREHY